MFHYSCLYDILFGFCHYKNEYFDICTRRGGVRFLRLPKNLSEPNHTREHVALILSAPPSIAGALRKLPRFVLCPSGVVQSGVKHAHPTSTMLALQLSLLSFAAHDPALTQTA